MNIAAKLYHWLFKRSHKNAANPNPIPMPHQSNSSGPWHGRVQPLETSMEEDATIGINFSLGKQHSLSKALDGELIRSHKNVSILCGCNHIVSQLQASHEEGKLPVRGLAGKCLYCEKEFQKLIQKGKVDPLEAERMSLVCTDCARVTVSGILCCPRHYVTVDNGNNQIVYWGPDEQARQSRKQVVQNILTPLTGFFIEQNPQQLPSPEDDNE